MKDPYERSQYNGYVDSIGIYNLATEKTLPNQLLGSGLAHLDVLLKIKYLALLDSLSRSSSKEKINRDIDNLRLTLARVEYAIWKSANEVNLRQWMTDTMKPEVDLNSPTISFIKDVFGEQSPIYLLFTRP